MWIYVIFTFYVILCDYKMWPNTSENMQEVWYSRDFLQDFGCSKYTYSWHDPENDKIADLKKIKIKNDLIKLLPANPVSRYLL